MSNSLGNGKWRHIFAHSVEVLREQGIRGLLFAALGRTIYRRLALIETPLDKPLAEVKARLPVVIGLLKETEVGDYVVFRPEADPSEILGRLKAGHWCFVARHEGRIVHAGWVATGRAWIDYLDREITLAPNEFYIYDVFTLPDYRGFNIAPARLALTLRYFREAGYRRSIAGIVPENWRSFRTAEKNRGSLFAIMGYVKLGPLRRDFCRVKGKSPPPGGWQPAHGSAYWDAVVERLANQPHYRRPFPGDLKRQMYLELIRRGGGPTIGWSLKTDLFEEAMGQDTFLTSLSEGEGTMVGIDVSEVAVRRAQNEDTARKAQYVITDVRWLPFKDDSFDLIVSPSTLDHFADPSDLGRSLQELARGLRPDGHLIITLDNRQNVFDPLVRIAIWLGLAPFYIGPSHSASELREELEAAGLTVQDTTAVLHSPRPVAAAALAVANKLPLPPFRALVLRAMKTAEALEGTRWCYRTGFFVAAKAVKPNSTTGGHGPMSEGA